MACRIFVLHFISKCDFQLSDCTCCSLRTSYSKIKGETDPLDDMLPLIFYPPKHTHTKKMRLVHLLFGHLFYCFYTLYLYYRWLFGSLW